MRFIIIVTIFLTINLYAEDQIQDNFDKKLSELDKKYLRAKRKLLIDARDDYKTLEVTETKKGNLDGALEYRKKTEAFEDKIDQLDFAMKKDEPVETSELGETGDIRDMEKALGYKLSSLIRMRDHKDAIKFDETGHYYKYFPINGTWEDAQKKCKSMGGHLVTITDQKEDDFVLLLAQGKYSASSFVCIGLSREPGKQWEWVTGEPLEFGAGKGQTPGQNVVGLWKAGKWADTENNNKLIGGFICEWPK